VHVDMRLVQAIRLFLFAAAVVLSLVRPALATVELRCGQMLVRCHYFSAMFLTKAAFLAILPE